MKTIFFKFRNRYFFLLDLIAFAVIPFLALTIIFEGFKLNFQSAEIIQFAFTFGVLKILVLYIWGIYNRYWDHASIDDLLLILFSGISILFAQFSLGYILKQCISCPFQNFPFSILVLDSVFSTFFVAMSRLSFRIYYRTTLKAQSKQKMDNALIVGAGQAGVTVLQELERNKKALINVVGFIDDDKKKIGLSISGVKIRGSRSDIIKIALEFNIKKIIIAIPSAPGDELKKIIKICEQLKGIEILTVPPLYDIINNKVEINKLRKVEIEDLLRRKPIKTDIEKIFKMIEGRSVLVTGAGGSIGSELSRQILNCKPKALYLLGHGENSIFEIDAELKKLRTGIKIEPIIADIKDLARLEYIFNKNSFNFIFHAAAHKHVPLMEANPYEALKNNVVGTKNLIECAVKYDIEKFIMISTDKAVNPTNIMGTTKRIAEMLVIEAANKFNKSFSVVRFGNVLGSRGSVVRIFKQQIENGGPITLTHPDIERFFMTIPEAVQLVLQAFILGTGGEIFVLDMGKPIKIISLAEDLIRLSGLEVGKDIEIKITGLRPGEKLYEELFIKGETFRKTGNDKIFIAENASHSISENFNENLRYLIDLIDETHKDAFEYKELLKRIVPEYKTSNNGVYV